MSLSRHNNVPRADDIENADSVDVIVHLVMLVIMSFMTLMAIVQLFISSIEDRTKVIHRVLTVCASVLRLVETLILFGIILYKVDLELFLLARACRWFAILIATYLYYKVAVYSIDTLGNLDLRNGSKKHIPKWFHPSMKALFCLNVIGLVICVAIALASMQSFALKSYNIFFSCLIIYCSVFVCSLVIKIRMQITNIIGNHRNSIRGNDGIAHALARTEKLQKARYKIDLTIAFIVGLVLFQASTIIFFFTTKDPHKYHTSFMKDRDESIYSSAYPGYRGFITEFSFSACWLCALIAWNYEPFRKMGCCSKTDASSPKKNEIKNKNRDFPNYPGTPITATTSESGFPVCRSLSFKVSDTIDQPMPVPVKLDDMNFDSLQKEPTQFGHSLDMVHQMVTMDPKIVISAENTVGTPTAKDLAKKRHKKSDEKIRKYPEHQGSHATKLSKIQKKYRKDNWKEHHHNRSDFEVVTLKFDLQQVSLNSPHSKDASTEIPITLPTKEKKCKILDSDDLMNVIMNELLPTMSDEFITPNSDEDEDEQDPTIDVTISRKASPCYINDGFVYKLDNSGCQIKLILMEFDNVLCTFANKFHKATLATVKDMTDKSLFLSFGGESRIAYIKQHLSHMHSNRPLTYCVAPNHFGPAMHTVLRRLDYLQYFTATSAKVRRSKKYSVLGWDHPLIKRTDNKVHLIILKLIDHFKIKHSNVLYIGHDASIISHLNQISLCNTYFVKTNGMNYNDVQKCETAFF